MQTIFRHLIGKYEILSLSEEKNLKTDIAAVNISYFNYFIKFSFSKNFNMILKLLTNNYTQQKNIHLTFL